ncbi:TRAP-type C4-dicarboxylate transport system permease small subunit [Evansella vedderi]|uniref:TRAP-type C4-dicarboxylate transport system permease small subunit n=1 Tax=Evansella vedderi TaxID=38282 RepID=A0ABT9ZXD4_9BACI|nr:TRAP transporter small permease [Evansella vedderi]MDQ0255892.1 TRAP-type C4-dicarboxylate transport system permease small subunit [Evansella vedderi]
MKKFLNNFEEIVGGSLFIAMFIVLVAQIFAREFFSSPLVWSEELAQLIFIYVGLLGVSACIKDNSHVSIDFFVLKFPPVLQKIINIFIQVLILACVALIFFISIRITGRQVPIDIVSLKISSVYKYIALPILSSLIIYRLLERNYLAWKRRERGVEQ